MTKEEFRKIAYVMKAVYTQPAFLPDKEAFRIWYEFLKDLPAADVQQAVQMHIMTSKFAPTVADIRELAAMNSPDISRDLELNELAAWGMVSKAIQNSGYHAQQEFDALPPLVQKAVGSPSLLRTWALMDPNSVETVGQSHFVRVYRTVLERAKTEARLPKTMRLQTQKHKFLPTIDI